MLIIIKIVFFRHYRQMVELKSVFILFLRFFNSLLTLHIILFILRVLVDIKTSLWGCFEDDNKKKLKCTCNSLPC